MTRDEHMAWCKKRANEYLNHGDIMNGMMERVDEMLTAPVVGKYYLVPTVLFEFHSVIRPWPIMGTKHDDAEHLNFPHLHYHFDWRFIAPKMSIYRRSETLQLNFGLILHYIGRELPAPIYRRRRCQRPMPLNTIFSMVPTGMALHRAWAGKDAHRDAHGLICPHRGTALGSITPQPDGSITCPLHGLKFCATTGRSIPTCP